MTTLITNKGFNTLKEKLHTLRYIEQPKITQLIEDSRPTGCVEDNPEYLYAMDLMASLNKKVSDLEFVLSDCLIFTNNMIKSNIVNFGATVTLLNIDSDKEITYTILSKYEADLSKNIISIESPFAQEMLGLTINDEFSVNDNDYEIISICYASQE